MRSSRRASGPTGTRWRSGTTSSPMRRTSRTPSASPSGSRPRSLASAASRSHRRTAWRSPCGGCWRPPACATFPQDLRATSSSAGRTGAPSFGEVWPAFRSFIGDDVLIAHNGQRFDVPVLRRLAAGREGGGVDSLAFYDTLPLVRSLSRDSGKLEDLALRFGIDGGRAHHALDDAGTLARGYHELEGQRGNRARQAGVGD